MAILFAAVADDDTGATDLAGILADQGVRVVLAIDSPSTAQLAKWAESCDAVILGVASRALPPSTAYDRMREGVRLLESLDPRMIYVKYCSTFDSTPKGNIGSSIDAALDELGEDFTVAVPALPVNGRTTYMGHHFVHDKLLSDSSMRHHPLTPMANSSLISHLASQTSRKVGLAPYTMVRAGANSLKNHLWQLRQTGVNIAIVDCVHDDDLRIICDACRGMSLMTGSSGPATPLPPMWERELGWKPAEPDSLLPRISAVGRGMLIAAGSCSPATRDQNEALIRDGCDVFDFHFLGSGNDGEAEDIVPQIRDEMQTGRVCLLRTVRTADDVQRVHEWARQHGLTEREAGERIAWRLANLVGSIVDADLPEGLIVAGGETSGAVCRALSLGVLRIGANIQPGLCTESASRALVALG